MRCVLGTSQCLTHSLTGLPPTPASQRSRGHLGGSRSGRPVSLCPQEQSSPLLRGTQATSECCLEEPNLPNDPSTPVSSLSAIPGRSFAREVTVNPHYPRGVYILAGGAPHSLGAKNAGKMSTLGSPWGGSPVCQAPDGGGLPRPQEAEELLASENAAICPSQRGGLSQQHPQAPRPQW